MDFKFNACKSIMCDNSLTKTTKRMQAKNAFNILQIYVCISKRGKEEEREIKRERIKKRKSRQFS